MTVRVATAEDHAAVLGIVGSIPDLPQWTVVDLAVCERSDAHASESSGGEPSAMSGGELRRVLLVAEVCGRVLGFAQVAAVAGEAELEGMGVLAGERRGGVGRALLEACTGWAAKAGAELLRLEVRRGNIAAQILYRSAGLRAVGERRDYYREPVEDAVLMQCNL